jgi:hypothetical protein
MRFMKPISTRAWGSLLALMVLLALGVVLTAPVATTPAATPTSRAQTARPSVVTVTISPRAPTTRIPRSFLGFSTEYWTLPVDERHTSIYERLLALVHVPGDGPFVLRIGGDSSDQAVWDPDARRLPAWAFAVTPALVKRTASIVRRLHLRVILDINTLSATPKSAAAFVRAAKALLPPASVIGYAIGNEPDLYTRAAWTSILRGSSFYIERLPPVETPRRLILDYDKFARAVSQATPGVPLMGVALAHPYTNLKWDAALVARANPKLQAITIHRYPYSDCSAPGTATYPTVQKLLSEPATAGDAATIKPTVALGRRAGLPVRLSELNSVTCGGTPGVSNTFATALWFPDAVFEFARAGVSAVNLHVRAYTINAPFSFDRAGISARPLLYGILLFRRMLGPDSRLIDVNAHSGPRVHLKVWAVSVGAHVLNVLLINKGTTSTTVNLDLPATRAASVIRLLAPSAASQAGESLAGQQLSDRLTWIGRRHVETITGAEGRYSVHVRGQSAALLTVSVDDAAARS